MKKFITASIFLAISLNAQTLATVNNQEIKVEDVNNFLKSTDQNMDYNKLDNKAKNLTLQVMIYLSIAFLVAIFCILALAC